MLNEHLQPHHAEHPLLEPFINRLTFEKLEAKSYEKGIYCLVRGTNAYQQKSTTKVEIELKGNNVIVYHYVNGAMQDRFHKPTKLLIPTKKKATKKGKAKPESGPKPKTNDELLNEFVSFAEAISPYSDENLLDVLRG